ncbi:MAG: aminoacyl-histidine dipeptidase [Lachnospiraceae bacterium]|nr:aminoacyl-histidine dipeptidase [Lachnospiraceae bacterium]
MGVLDGLKPEKVFGFFEEICRIPHGSGNVTAISNYLVDFAKKRQLYCKQDALNNVIIVKEASSGYESEPAVILQGHMDMVAVKKPDCTKDLQREGLDLRVNGDDLYAEGTSLGGDDGIAVAYALAILDDDTLKHPKLEIVITVDEEVGMEGARGIDLSDLTGRRLLNLDSEEEGIFLTSCAGGARVDTYLPVALEKQQGMCLRIGVEGMAGGHSGADIHKEKGNSNCLMGRILYRLTAEMPVFIKRLEGGLADNAIPRQTTVELLIAPEREDALRKLISQAEAEIKAELAVKDPDFHITLTCEGEEEILCTDAESSAQLAAYLIALPNGVQAMSADIEGLVETSLNLGIMKYNENEQELVCSFSVRSSVESAKKALVDKICAITELAGGSYSMYGDYPGWAYRANSPLREKMVLLYEEMYGKKPQLTAIHAGLECGILAGKLEGLDCISFGPDIRNIHTTEESLSISSTERVWNYLVKLLERKD